MCHFYKQFTGTEKLCLRRCQANHLIKRDYIGEHKDQGSSPDYLATIVFHFSEDYSGGFFVTDEKQNYKPAAYTALVNNCSVSHLVTEVESGERLTLACFLSPSFSANKKNVWHLKSMDSNLQFAPDINGNYFNGTCHFDLCFSIFSANLL